MKRFFHVVFILAFSMAIIGCGQKASIAQPAPDFTLNDLNGNSVSLADFKGKVIILDFFATWCPPCREEIPHLVELQNVYANKGLQTVGISLDKTGIDSVKKFVTSYNINYPVAIATGKIIKDYGPIQFIPTIFVIDKNGNIAKKYVGFKAKDILEKDIKQLL